MTLSLIIEIVIFILVVAVTLVTARGLQVFLHVRRRLGFPMIGKTARALLKVYTFRNPVLRWVRSSTSLNDSKDYGKLRQELAVAGFDHPAAPVWYVIFRFLLAVGLPIGFLVSQSMSDKPMIGAMPSFVAMGLCGLGLIAPRFFIRGRANARRAQLEHEFPDALDLLVVCLEAGLGIEAAFVRVGQEVHESHPMVAKSFGRLARELSAGRGRAEALRAMAERASVDTIRSFVGLLIQTDALGVSIGQTLRTFSTEMRETRFLRAEEKAMRIPVLMTIPLTACILPVIMAALLLPAIIGVVRVLAPALAGNH